MTAQVEAAAAILTASKQLLALKQESKSKLFEYGNYDVKKYNLSQEMYNGIMDGSIPFDPVTLQYYAIIDDTLFQLNPSLFMKRGDVVCFEGGGYRNNCKFIFDGTKLDYLYYEVDDYGTVSPNYLAGDKEDEFPIGYFSESIDHNSINWLSKEKLREIQFTKFGINIVGSVEICGKLFKIRLQNHMKSLDIEVFTAKFNKYLDSKKFIGIPFEDYGNGILEMYF